MDSTMDKLEEYLSAMEEYVFASLSSAAPEGMKDKMNQLWIDITRYGPSISINDVTSRIPSPFEIPPPPPPPPPKSWSEMAADWVDENPRILACATVVGVGILAGLGYRRSWYGRKIRRLGSKAGKAASRRKVVVVLGADTSPLALPLILELERNGYIVIASVTSVEAVDELERKCRGSDELKAGDSGSGSYVKALVLDPTSALPDAVPVFLRSLASTLGRRFPITASGDPYASPADHPYVQAVVSMLTMPSNSPLSVSSETSITHVSSHAPLEHISLRSTYLSYLSQTQITPLQVIQGLLPLLRNVHVPSEKEEPKMVVVCVPSESATSVSPGLAFKSLQTMSTVSTRAAISVLRDEVDVAARTGKSEGMRGIKVVEVNVDSSILDTLSYESLDNATTTTEQDVYKAMEKWTASEKVTYGPAFIRFVEDNFTPTKARSSNLNSKSLSESSIFTQTILAVISNGRSGYGYGYGPGTSFSRRLGRVFGFGTGLFGFAGKRDSVVIRRGNGHPHGALGKLSTLFLAPIYTFHNTSHTLFLYLPVSVQNTLNRMYAPVRQAAWSLRRRIWEENITTQRRAETNTPTSTTLVSTRLGTAPAHPRVHTPLSRSINPTTPAPAPSPASSASVSAASSASASAYTSEAEAESEVGSSWVDLPRNGEMESESDA